MSNEQKVTKLQKGLRVVGCCLGACLILCLLQAVMSICSPIRFIALGGAVASMIMAVMSAWHTIRDYLNIPRY